MITLRSDKIDGRICQLTSRGRFLRGGLAAFILENALYALSWGVERFLPQEGEETIEIILPWKKGYRKRPIMVSFKTLVRVAVFEGLWHRQPEGYWNPNHESHRLNEELLFEKLDWPDLPGILYPMDIARQGYCPVEDIERWMEYLDRLQAYFRYKRRSRFVKTAQY